MEENELEWEKSNHDIYSNFLKSNIEKKMKN